MKIIRGEVDRAYNTALPDTGNKNNYNQGSIKPETDRIELSDKAKEYSHVDRLTDAVIKEATKQTPSDKLLKIKSSISAGTYNVPSDEIAAAMIGHTSKLQ